MIDTNATKGKHLTLEDRSYIEDALAVRYPLKEMAKYLKKDSTTISKEIKRHRIKKKGKTEFTGGCANRKDCQLKHLCSETCTQFCKNCKISNCYRICNQFKEYRCTRLQKFPHVCNGCDSKIGCRLSKYYYRSKVADATYRDNLAASRKGIGVSQRELEIIDQLVSPLVLKGQSLSHIYAHHEDEIGLSQRTLYNYFDLNLFEARNIDLRRKVRFKPRRKKKPKSSRDTKCRIGRTYEEFEIFLTDHPDTPVVEMDTVEGKKGGKVLLTLFFRNCSLMLAVLMDACTQKCVKSAIDSIYSAVGHQVFRDCFPVILTDNGSEFKDPWVIECDKDGNHRTKIFYCDPLASHQKARIERNHEYIRYILPKGKPFDLLTQEKVTLMINHINSAARASRNGTTPFKLAQLLMNSAFIESLSLVEVDPDEVHLKPALLE